MRRGFLKSLYAERGNWSAAAGAYHSQTPARANVYRARFDRIVAGLGGAPLTVAAAAPEAEAAPARARGAAQEPDAAVARAEDHHRRAARPGTGRAAPSARRRRCPEATADHGGPDAGPASNRLLVEVSVFLLRILVV